MQTATRTFDSRLLALLECPRDHGALRRDGDCLCCAAGHRYPIVDGVPVFLLAEKQQTIGIATASLQAAESGTGGPLYSDTLGLSQDQRRAVEKDWAAGARVDPAISYLVAATSGLGYVDMVGRLHDYPIPDIPIERSAGDLLLDIGSNWGRWSVSAARKGWRAVAIDPSLGALMASRRAFASLGLDIAFVCGDARYLPFKANTFGGVFSYSVIQHFSEADAETSIAEMGRVLRHGGVSKVQMAHAGGLRSTYIRTRRGYMDSGVFRVRYWPLEALRNVFEKNVGPSRLIPEAFGGLGLLPEDRKFASFKARLLIGLSQVLKALSRVVPGLIRLADSVYVVSAKR